MKGIQNKIIISQKAFNIHIYGLHHCKEKVSAFFSEYITFSVNFSVGSLGGTEQLFHSLLYLPNRKGMTASFSGSCVVLNAPLMYWGVEAGRKSNISTIIIIRRRIKNHTTKEFSTSHSSLNNS
jgi:hypothetical protein